MTIRKNTEQKAANISLLRFGKLMLILGISLMISVSALAQDPPPDQLTDPDAPFDGGISLLVAAGVVYGAKQWHNSRKSNGKNDTIEER